MKSNRETVIAKTISMIAANRGVKVDQEITSGIHRIFDILERKDGWIQSPRQNRTNKYWLVCETKDGTVLKEQDGTFTFGLLVKAKSKFTKEIIDILFAVKRDQEKAYDKLFSKMTLVAQ